jgi:hypothetical protein
LCRHGTDVYTKTALMVLMISVKVIKRVICRLLLFCE